MMTQINMSKMKEQDKIPEKELNKMEAKQSVRVKNIAYKYIQ